MKRKSIIIGELYLFDVLNETNMAVSTSLVRVIKKVKRNTYTVLSVNTGDIFNTHAKYLLQYTDPKYARIIRCHYGTTEFNFTDIKLFDLILNYIDLTSRDINNQVSNNLEINLLKELIIDMQEKVTKYVRLSSYKDIFSILCNAYKKQSKNNTNNDDLYNPDNMSLNKNFTENFDKVTKEYINGNISYYKFLDDATNVIKKYFPSDALKTKKEKDIINDENFECLVESVSQSVQDGNVVFVIGKDDNDDITVQFYDNVNDVSDELMDYIHHLYKRYKQNNGCYIADFYVALLSVRKKFNIDNEDDE